MTLACRAVARYHDGMIEDGTQAMTVRLPVPLYEWLRRTAFEQHTSMSQLIIAAIKEKRDGQEHDAGSTT